MSDFATTPAPESEVGKFDDFKAFNETMKSTLKEASVIIGAYHRGFTKEEKIRFKKELPQIVARIRQLLEAQLEEGGSIRELDMDDGSYDNKDLDLALMRQLQTLRNLNTDLNSMIGTRMIRKLTAFISEDIPNWMTIRWRQLKDNTSHLLKTGAIVGGVGGAVALAGYSTAGALFMKGGVGAGLETLGTHIGLAAEGTYNVASSIFSGIGWTAGKIKALLGGALSVASTSSTISSAPATSAAAASTSGIWSVGSKIKNFLGW